MMFNAPFIKISFSLSLSLSPIYTFSANFFPTVVLEEIKPSSYIKSNPKLQNLFYVILYLYPLTVPAVYSILGQIKER